MERKLIPVCKEADKWFVRLGPKIRTVGGTLMVINTADRAFDIVDVSLGRS